MNEFPVKQKFNDSVNCNNTLISEYSCAPPMCYSYLNIGVANISSKSNDNKEIRQSIKNENTQEVCESTNKDNISQIEIKEELIVPISPVVNNKNENGYFSIHHEEYVIVCDMCDFQSGSHREMDIHRLSHGLKKTDPYCPNNVSLNKNDDSLIRKKHACDMCPYSAKTSQQLVSHKKSHSLEKAYACTQCSYKCKYLSGLKYHELSHSNTKLFRCDECGFNCLTRGLLKSHKRKHSASAPFVCNFCSYRSKYPAGLRYHMLTHTKGKDISCDLCSYACRTQAELKIHSRKHAPEPLTCEFCGFTCKIPKTMAHHKTGCKYQAS